MPAPRYKRAPQPRSTAAVIYVGPQRPGVTIVQTGTFAPFGVPVQVPAELAGRLLDQPVWAAAPVPPPEAGDTPADEKEQ